MSVYAFSTEPVRNNQKARDVRTSLKRFPSTSTVLFEKKKTICIGSFPENGSKVGYRGSLFPVNLYSERSTFCKVYAPQLVRGTDDNLSLRKNPRFPSP